MPIKFDLKAPVAGAYVTTKAHRLPKPDRRLRGGWLSTEGVPAGTVVIVKTRSLKGADVAEWRRNCTEVTLELPGTYSVSGRAEFLVSPNGEPASGMDETAAAYAREIADDLLEHHGGTCILDWIEAGSDARRWEAVLSTLLRAGRVSEADIRTAMKINDVEDDRRFDAEAYVRGWRYADEGVPIAEIGEKVRNYQGGGEDTITAASAGASARQQYMTVIAQRATDAYVADQARVWAEHRHPLPAFEKTRIERLYAAEATLEQIRELLAGKTEMPGKIVIGACYQGKHGDIARATDVFPNGDIGYVLLGSRSAGVGCTTAESFREMFPARIPDPTPAVIDEEQEG